MTRIAFILVGVFAVAAAGLGCSRRSDASAGDAERISARTGAASAPATAPAGDPSPAARTFDRPDLGVRLEVPAGWMERRSKDFVLLLSSSGKDAAKNAEAAPDAPTISLDVPDLPPHVPGMIPIGSVRNGYLEDLRKAVGKLKTEDQKPPNVPSASARMVRSTWSDSKGQAQQETALLMVHADRVYIVRARSRTSDEPTTRSAFDGIVASLQWTKKSAAKGK